MIGWTIAAFSFPAACTVLWLCFEGFVRWYRKHLEATHGR